MIKSGEIYYLHPLILIAESSMAGCNSRLSQDEINCLILYTVIKKVATPTVLKVFNASIPPNDLANVLNSNAHVIKELCKKKVINADQLNVLVRVPGVQFTFQSNVQHQKGCTCYEFEAQTMHFNIIKMSYGLYSTFDDDFKDINNFW